MTLDEFNAGFVWKADRIDGWRILRGDLRGDCDDYAATVAYITTGSLRAFWWAVAMRRVQFWYCTDPRGEAHMMLHIAGKGWIDNWFPQWSEVPRHTKRKRAWLLTVAIKMLVGKFTK